MLHVQHFKNSSGGDDDLEHPWKHNVVVQRCQPYDIPQMDWIMIPGDPLIYAGTNLTKCLAVEDIQAKEAAGLRDGDRRNVYITHCNSSSDLQQWNFDQATMQLTLSNSLTGFVIGTRRCLWIQAGSSLLPACITRVICE
jgi:hypothetical protein